MYALLYAVTIVSGVLSALCSPSASSVHHGRQPPWVGVADNGASNAPEVPKYPSLEPQSCADSQLRLISKSKDGVGPTWSMHVSHLLL